MHLPPPLRRLAAPALLVLVLSGCGGSGSSGDGKAAGTPCPAAASTDAATDGPEAQVARPVPKRDPRELDRMTAADATLVSLLRSVEQGGPAAPLQPAEPPHEPRHESVCPPPADAAAGAH